MTALEIHLLETFAEDYRTAINLLVSSNEVEAETFFNATMYPRYNKLVHDKKSVLKTFLSYFADMDEYFNNSGARYLGVSYKDKLIGYFYSDFEEVLKAAKERVEHLEDTPLA